MISLCRIFQQNWEDLEVQHKQGRMRQITSHTLMLVFGARDGEAHGDYDVPGYDWSVLQKAELWALACELKRGDEIVHLSSFQ